MTAYRVEIIAVGTELLLGNVANTDAQHLSFAKTDRRIHFGLYGNMDLMDVPANIASYTEKTIRQNYIPARTFMNTVTNNPSIMVGGASTNNNVERSSIIQGYLESSNVQVVDEMVNMIVAQRAYELNSKAITASDEMLQQANNLRR